jgi:hypothetical protein
MAKARAKARTVATSEPAMVSVRTLQPHSYHNVPYEVGDTYEIPEVNLGAVTGRGWAMRTDEGGGGTRKRATAATAEETAAPTRRRATARTTKRAKR